MRSNRDAKRRRGGDEEVVPCSMVDVACGTLMRAGQRHLGSLLYTFISVDEVKQATEPGGGGGPLQCAPRRTGGPRWRSHTVPSDREGPQRGVRRAGDEPLPKVDRNDRHRPMHVPDTAPHASNPYVGRVEDDAQPPTRRWAPSRVWVLHTHSSSSAAASPIPCLQDMSDLGTQREWRGLLRRPHDPWSRSSTLTAEDAPRVVTPAELYGLLR